MGGVSVFAWLALGGAGGWVISRLMARADDDARRGTDPPPELRFTRPDAAVESSPGPAPVGRPTPTYALTRNQLVSQLLSDASAHEAGRYDEIGRGFAGVERALPRQDAPDLRRLAVAMAFWDGWIDARNRAWEHDGGIATAEWPLLARTVAADLEGDRDVTDIRVIARFDAGVYLSLGARMQTLAARVRAG